MRMKLGKLPARHDARAPKMAALSLFGRQAPARLIRDHIDPSPQMLANNTLGNCTSAGLGNSFRAQASLAGFQVSVTDAEAISFYSKSTGYVPGNAATDRGGVEVDVLAIAARDGYALAAQTLYPIWGNIDLTNLNGVRLCMAAFGTVYCGFALAEADEASVDAVWDTTTPGDQTPGSWGGHCALLWSYSGTDDSDVVDVLTWGGIQKATWRWVRSRADEFHAVAWNQIAPASGLLSGQDWDKLRADNSSYLMGR
ncbi:hypothetical protein [Acetobacter sp. DsW_063]|uniref:hypothetical protein n=1 Tax=Acetobacter sp. DsW_063 TaxID=1514894 RepID=UPI000B642C2D|nr:hypothetical protein [Acetobacter sp. DsW_063]OUJ16473.1 hypothetical protein HK28_12390 [Acetobacter sp. DsW_063]